MAQNPRTDEYGNPIVADTQEFENRAQQSSQGYTAPPPQAPPQQQGFTPQQRDSVVNGWLSYARAQPQVNRGTIESYLASGPGTQGWRIERDDKVYDPGGRIYDWIGDVNTPNATARSGYTTDSRFANVTGAKKTTAAPKRASNPGLQTGAPAAARPAAAPAQDPRMAALYQQLLDRSQQSLNVDRNDPAIRNAADANSANETRAQRNYLADIAERAGPNANLRGEERMASERAGQRSGMYEADLVLREQTARRQEIQDALDGRFGVLSFEQQQALQLKKMQIDEAIQRAQMAQQNTQFNADLGYRNRALDQNQGQFNTNMGFNYDQFAWARSPLNPANFPQG